MYSGRQFGGARNCRYKRVHACKQGLQCAAQDPGRHHDRAMDALNRRMDRQSRAKTLQHKTRTNTPETRVSDKEQATTKCKQHQQKHPQQKSKRHQPLDEHAPFRAKPRRQSKQASKKGPSGSSATLAQTTNPKMPNTMLQEKARDSPKRNSKYRSEAQLLFNTLLAHYGKPKP